MRKGNDDNRNGKKKQCKINEKPIRLKKSQQQNMGDPLGSMQRQSETMTEKKNESHINIQCTLPESICSTF